MAKVTMPKLESKTFQGWGFVLVAGLLLALYAMLDSDDTASTTTTSTGADGSTGCQLEVTTDQVNVRAGPDQNAELLRVIYRGDIVDGTRVETNFYRQLEDGTWATSQYLTPVPGTNCA
jgi:hypothetical protein